MKTKLLFLFAFVINILQAAPSVTIVPYPGIQDANTTSNVIYFKVTFTEDVAGFTESDIVVSGTANANNAYIQSKTFIGDPLDYRNYLVGVTGMWTEGTVSITIPANVAYSNNDGTGNFVSNTPIVNYTFPLLAFSTLVGNTTNQSYTLAFGNFNAFPLTPCTKDYTGRTSGAATTNRGLRYVNNTSLSVCVGITVARFGSTPVRFNVYKDFLPTDFSNEAVYYAGGVDGEDFTPSQRNGYTYTYGNAYIYPGQTFYVMAENQPDTNFYITISNLPLSSLNYLSTKENSLKEVSKIFPNPVKDVLNINTKNVDFAKIYDASGKLVKTSLKQSQINVVELPKGNYFIEISENGKVSKQKFIKN